MEKVKWTSIDQYLAAQPAEARAALQQVRAAIAAAVPEAVEAISYNMPAFKYSGRVLVYFAAWQRHYALYPADASVVDDFHQDLAPYDVDKGTIRFPYSLPVPVDLITAIARYRAKKSRPARRRAGG
jgi:uncharacterized protein YdhG (YjbR/CyaY superfamily)